MGAKKKLTAKEKEELKIAAELEQKKIEAEEARKAAEIEAKRKAEEERRAAEEKKRREEELIRLTEQEPFLNERNTQMYEKRNLAVQSRMKVLDDKYLACNPLPDPENEKDLTTFISLWKDQNDKDLQLIVENCQTAEDVCKAINLLLAEAMAQYDFKKIEWCRFYISELRALIIKKYEFICAHVLIYIENYWQYTEEEKQQIRDNAGAKRNQDLNQKPEINLIANSHDLMFGIWANVQGKSMNMKDIKFGKWNTQLPRSHSSVTLILRCFWTSFDYISSAEDLLKSDVHCVGGIINCQMYAYPELPKDGSRWKMRKVQTLDETLRNIPYPDPASSVQADPIMVSYKLADNVFTTEDDEIQVGVWDETKKVWETDLIEDLQFDREKRLLNFLTRKFGPIAFLQPKTTDYPYDSWYLRSIGEQLALCTIVTKRIKVEIEIHPLFVKLSEMNQPELKHLNNKEMHPGILLMELSKCGIHLLPEDSDAETAGIKLKDRDAEEKAIIDMACCVKSFAFQSLKWNQQAPDDTIICRFRQNPDHFKRFFEDGEDDWDTLMWWKNKVAFIDAKNSDKSFNGEIKKGQVTHAMLPLAVRAIVESKIPTGQQIPLDTVDQCSFVNDIDFIDNVQRTLRLLRLPSFTIDAYDKRTLEQLQL